MHVEMTASLSASDAAAAMEPTAVLMAPARRRRSVGLRPEPEDEREMARADMLRGDGFVGKAVRVERRVDDETRRRSSFYPRPDNNWRPLLFPSARASLSTEDSRDFSWEEDDTPEIGRRPQIGRRQALLHCFRLFHCPNPLPIIVIHPSNPIRRIPDASPTARVRPRHSRNVAKFLDATPDLAPATTPPPTRYLSHIHPRPCAQPPRHMDDCTRLAPIVGARLSGHGSEMDLLLDHRCAFILVRFSLRFVPFSGVTFIFLFQF